MDSESLRPESETKILWRRLFADCRQGLRKLLLCVIVVVTPVLCMFAVEIASAATGSPSWLAFSYGIRPLQLTWQNFFSIVFLWPFLHFGWQHLLGNAPFCLALGFLVAIRSVWDFFVVWTLSCCVGGLGVFFTGGIHTIHAGASGVITGFFGCLLLRVLFERSLASLLWALFVGIFYGSLFYVLIPSEAYSWQGHLFGFLGGVLAAALLGTCKRKKNNLSEGGGSSLSSSHSNVMGSEEMELTPFDDFKLEHDVDRLASEEAMMREVQQSMSTSSK